jgi:hypothetical protein|nr:MAG TPA: hypothetical protein [Caudoviricetes sp.]DAW25341.1 MAG TPA: hypothetical protein [Caudoviricetes sp.]
MTLDRIHEAYSNTFFCQLSKWGSTLSLEEAKSLGLPVDVPVDVPVDKEKATPAKRPARKPKNNNNKEE